MYNTQDSAQPENGFSVGIDIDLVIVWAVVIDVISGAFFGSILDNFGNSGKSTITKQKHRKKGHATANRMTVFFFLFLRSRNRGMATGIFRFPSKANSCGKIPMAIPRFLIRKKKLSTFHSPWFGLSYGAFAIVFYSSVNLLRLIHRDSRNLRELSRGDFSVGDRR